MQSVERIIDHSQAPRAPGGGRWPTGFVTAARVRFWVRAVSGGRGSAPIAGAPSAVSPTPSSLPLTGGGSVAAMKPDRGGATRARSSRWEGGVGCWGVRARFLLLLVIVIYSF